MKRALQILTHLEITNSEPAGMQAASVTAKK